MQSACYKKASAYGSRVGWTPAWRIRYSLVNYSTEIWVLTCIRYMQVKGKGKERNSIYIAPFCTKVHTKRSGMDHTVLPANNTMPAFPSWRSPDVTTTATEAADIQLQLTTHLSTPKGWKAELVGGSPAATQTPWIFRCPRPKFRSLPLLTYASMCRVFLIIFIHHTTVAKREK